MSKTIEVLVDLTLVIIRNYIALKLIYSNNNNKRILSINKKCNNKNYNK